MTRSPALPGGTLVLDSEGLAKAVLRDRSVTGWLALARADDLRVITSAATLVEVVHSRINRPALEWTLSRLVVEPVTEPLARHAAALLTDAGLHGHKYAIDAVLGPPPSPPRLRHHPHLAPRGPDHAMRQTGHRDQGLILSTEDLSRSSLPLYTFFVYLCGMETIPLGELNHHPSKVTARVRAGETLVVTEHGKPVIRMSPAEQPTSALDQLAATGQLRRAVNPGALPELISDLSELPSLSDALIAERDRERTR